MQHQWRTGWLAGLTAGGVACVLLLVVPVESTAWVVLARGTSLAALAVFGLTNLRLPHRVRAVWWTIWVYEALTVVGDIVYDTQQRLFGEPPFPGPADGFYLTAYLAALVGLLMLVRRLHPGRDQEAWIDTLIVTIAAAAVVGVFVAVPTIADSAVSGTGTAIALLYPLLDLLVLSGLVRLMVGGRGSSPALMLLVTAFAITLLADLLFNLLTSSGLEDLSPAWLDTLFLASLVLMTAAASAPGSAQIDTPVVRSPQERAAGHLVGLTMGALTIPALLLLFGWQQGEAVVRILTGASMVVILLVLWRLRRLLTTVQEQSARLASQARTDALTGIPNRRTLDYEIERLDAAGADERPPLTVVMLDLDHFKDFNDRYGHRAGDDLLVRSAMAWRQALDGQGFLARYGGEEFTILLPGRDLVAARGLIESIRRATPGGLTVSAGVAQRMPGENGFQALDRADRALYAAKDAGRDRLVADFSGR